MSLARSFKDTVKARAERDPTFRRALLAECDDVPLADDIDTGLQVLRDCCTCPISSSGGAIRSPDPSVPTVPSTQSRKSGNR